MSFNHLEKMGEKKHTEESDYQVFFYQNDIDKLVGQRYSLLMHLQYCRIFYRIFVKSKRLGPMTFLYRVCLA